MRNVIAYVLRAQGREITRVLVAGMTDEKRNAARRRLTKRADRLDLAHGSVIASVGTVWSDEAR